MTKDTVKQNTQTIWRWILFIPASIIASEITKYLINKLGGGIFNVFFPLLGQTISGIFSWTFTAIVLIFVAYKIIPSYKKTIIKIYAIIWTILIIGWTIFVYFLAKEGIAGSFWFPLLINLGFFAGLWGTYFFLFHQSKIVETTDKLD